MRRGPVSALWSSPGVYRWSDGPYPPYPRRITETMDDLLIEQQVELEQFGNPPRFDMRMFPLLGMEKPRNTVLIPALSEAHRQVVEEIGRQFRRELGFDFVPFDASDPEFEGVLIDSRKFLATFPIAAGAAGFERDGDRWIMKWVWLHPYERGTGRFADTWNELERRYGEFYVEGPYSPMMEAFIRKYGIRPDRHDRFD